MKSINNIVKNNINQTPAGQIIKLDDLNIARGKEYAAAKALSRMVLSGDLKRVKRGVYYKPERSKFGFLKPDEKNVLKEIIDESGGYLTGTAAYNSLGLTTQIPKTFVIASTYNRTPVSIAGVNIRFRRVYIIDKKINVKILQTLDALKDIKKIPDADINVSLKRIIGIIEDFDESDMKIFVKCALKYNPATRALVCAVFDQEFRDIEIGKLVRSLSAFSEYKIGIDGDVLRNKGKFKII